MEDNFKNIAIAISKYIDSEKQTKCDDSVIKLLNISKELTDSYKQFFDNFNNLKKTEFNQSKKGIVTGFSNTDLYKTVQEILGVGKINDKEEAYTYIWTEKFNKDYLEENGEISEKRKQNLKNVLMLNDENKPDIVCLVEDDFSYELMKETDYNFSKKKK